MSNFEITTVVNHIKIMIKLLFITLGSIFSGLGFLGIFIPGLPTTPFLLLAAACYVRSSDRLYAWLLHHNLLGKYIRDFEKTRSISLHGKIVSLIMMWTMISLSALVFIKIITVKIIIVILGLIGTFVILSIPTSRK